MSGYERVRARNSKGQYIKDDPKTKKNEAYTLKKRKKIMATANESFAKIAAHERECTIRYENIEKKIRSRTGKI